MVFVSHDPGLSKPAESPHSHHPSYTPILCHQRTPNPRVAVPCQNGGIEMKNETFVTWGNAGIQPGFRGEKAIPAERNTRVEKTVND